jgi:hypothetical protein
VDCQRGSHALACGLGSCSCSYDKALTRAFSIVRMWAAEASGETLSQKTKTCATTMPGWPATMASVLASSETLCSNYCALMVGVKPWLALLPSLLSQGLMPGLLLVY